jgi:hypothetical protein
MELTLCNGLPMWLQILDCRYPFIFDSTTTADCRLSSHICLLSYKDKTCFSHCYTGSTHSAESRFKFKHDWRPQHATAATTQVTLETHIPGVAYPMIYWEFEFSGPVRSEFRWGLHGLHSECSQLVYVISPLGIIFCSHDSELLRVVK